MIIYMTKEMKKFDYQKCTAIYREDKILIHLRNGSSKGPPIRMPETQFSNVRLTFGDGWGKKLDKAKSCFTSSETMMRKF